MVRLKAPTKTTLTKYGLTEKMWYNMLSEQSGKCPVCEREFSESLRPVIDHYHVRGFKKMTAEKKRRYVRGLLCNYCNRIRVAKGMTAKMAYNVHIYLLNFDRRSSE